MDKGKKSTLVLVGKRESFISNYFSLTQMMPKGLIKESNEANISIFIYTI